MNHVGWLIKRAEGGRRPDAVELEVRRHAWDRPEFLTPADKAAGFTEEKVYTLADAEVAMLKAAEGPGDVR